MIIVVAWWFWLQVMGLAALPLTHRFFARLPGRGYAFARPLGLLLSSYVLWLGGSLGLLRNSTGGALLAIALVAAASVAVYLRGRRGAESGDPGLPAWVRANLRLVVTVELLFAGALAFWAVLRAYSPELLTAGGEKFMEVMFLNSIGRSEYFPPHDAWLAGYGISYYYFGYVMMATLTRLAGFAAHLTFNVGLASLFALTCTGAFGLVYELVGSARRPGARAAPGPAPSGQADVGQGTPDASRVRRPPRPIAWGLLGAALVAVMGNLEGFLEVLYSARLLPVAFWQWLDIEEINQPFAAGQMASLLPTRSGWWWWRASRVIRDLDPLGQPMPVQPIDEFPGFSFLLGDMHPHVLALPFVLLALILAFWALRAGSDAPASGGPEGKEPWWLPVRRLPLLVPLCLGGLAFLNTWDFPIYWLILVVAYGLGRWKQYGALRWPFLRDVGLTGVAAAVLGLLLYLPFYIGFQSQAGGLLPTLYVGTRFRQYFVMFGPFLVALAGLLLLVARREVKAGRVGRGRLARRWLGWTAAFLLLPLAIMGVLVLGLLLTEAGRQALEGIRQNPAVYAIVGDRPWPAVLAQLAGVKLRTWLMPLVVAALAGLGAALLHSRLLARSPSTDAAEDTGQEMQEPAESAPPGASGGPGGEEGHAAQDALHFVLLCAVAGLLLTLSVEFVYLVDNFGVRMNTIFKFYFQAWVLMAVAGTFAVYRLSQQNRPRHLQTGGSGATPPRIGGAGGGLRAGFLVGFWLLFAMGMVYPLLGNYSRAGEFRNPPTLDGTAYLAQSQPDDYAAIAWLNENVEGSPVILEAPGEGASSYVYEGRVSALTGLPTLLGWAGHEGQWRGSYEIQGARERDIATIYNTLDPAVAQALLHEYGVTYVYVGPLERSKYDPRALAKFARFMEVVYQEADVTIYQLSE